MNPCSLCCISPCLRHKSTIKQFILKGGFHCVAPANFQSIILFPQLPKCQYLGHVPCSQTKICSSEFQSLCPERFRSCPSVLVQINWKKIRRVPSSSPQDQCLEQWLFGEHKRKISEVGLPHASRSWCYFPYHSCPGYTHVRYGEAGASALFTECQERLARVLFCLYQYAQLAL